jgi:hypothetical protein
MAQYQSLSDQRNLECNPCFPQSSKLKKLKFSTRLSRIEHWQCSKPNGLLCTGHLRHKNHSYALTAYTLGKWDVSQPIIDYS